MIRFNWTEWYGSRPVWIQWVLFPVILVGGLAFFVIWFAVSPVIFIFAVVYVMVRGYRENHRFWTRLKALDRVVSWSEVEAALAAGSATLVVQIGTKGPHVSWLIDQPRSIVDPDRVAPSWQDFEQVEYHVLFDLARREEVKGWKANHLPAFEPSAKALAKSQLQVRCLRSEVKQSAVLVVSARSPIYHSEP